MIKPKHSYPLHITISTLFISLILIFGLVLGGYNNRKTSDIILSTSSELFDQLGNEFSLKIGQSGRAVEQAVMMLSSSGITEARGLEERLRYLPLFCSALESAREMTALQVGYGDGEYFIVRPLDSDYMRDKFKGPDGSSFVADNISRHGGEATLERVWFSRSMVELGRAEPVPSSYDPRVRPWYKDALASPGFTGGDPYLFFFTHKVGLTRSYRESSKSAVVAGDVTLENLSARIAQVKVTEHSEIVLFHKSGKAVAYKDHERLVVQQDEKTFSLATIGTLGNDLLRFVEPGLTMVNSVVDISFEGQDWLRGIRQLEPEKQGEYFLLMLSPKSELLRQATLIQKRIMLITVAMILFTVPLTWLVARLISTPLRSLAEEVEQINRLDFSQPIEQSTIIREVDELARAMGMMKKTIDKFLTLSKSLANEQNFDDMLRLITKETMSVSQGFGAVTYLVDDSGEMLYPAVCLSQGDQVLDNDRFPEFTGADNPGVFALLEHDRPVSLSGLEENGPLISAFKACGIEEPGTGVLFPLHNREGEGTGLLCLFFNEAGDQQAHRPFLQTFAGLAAVSLESRKLLKMQKQLLDSFITLLAGAIDSKSPYTGGHCQRVPVITKMLAQKACDAKEGPYSGFDLTCEEWEALHIASWLHDCGKVTTPEYVVDKSTKLETLYDRIHEIRMRFEVLHREARITYWKGVAGGQSEAELKDELDQDLKQLQDDFAFVAECNLGGEFMADENIDRLNRVGSRTWERYFDDRLGVSWEERRRKEQAGDVVLPVVEKLLSDKKEHLIERPADEYASEDAEGFTMKRPELLFNRGELYNLKVRKGTLTDEERYRINDHIVQTIVMLRQLPYPTHLKDVPEIAGGHHEKMDGTGYPRGLNGGDMSIQARMMVIADIFEALTASDRPYKRPKTLSEAIRIMGFMARDNHIDRSLFELFLTGGVYLDYAREYLLPDQIDEVVISEYVKL